MNETPKSAVLPAGQYIVGDPCYAVEDQGLWMSLLESADFETNPDIYEAQHKQHQFTAVSTLHGDGLYYDEQGRSYGVDAGLIGVTPAPNATTAPHGTNLVHFDQPFQVSQEGGVITIGNLIIDTR